MTRNELIVKIENGSDIMFDVSGRHYTILTWPEEGISVVEQYQSDEQAPPRQYFKTAKELVDNFKVNGVTLGNIAAGVIITDYT